MTSRARGELRRREEITAPCAASRADVKAGESSSTRSTQERSVAARHADMPDPDLIVRTSGEMRLSQLHAVAARVHRALHHRSAVAGVRAAHLDEAFAAYGKRQRRFGLTGAQIQKGAR